MPQGLASIAPISLKQARWLASLSELLWINLLVSVDKALAKLLSRLSTSGQLYSRVKGLSKFCAAMFRP